MLAADKPASTFGVIAFMHRRREMITGNDERRLIELAFDYVAAETEQQATQAHDQAAMLATEITTFKIWLDLIEYIKAWNSSKEHNEPVGRARALQFFSTRRAEW
jgi:hypothetical protein